MQLKKEKKAVIKVTWSSEIIQVRRITRISLETKIAQLAKLKLLSHKKTAKLWMGLWEILNNLKQEKLEPKKS